MQIHGGSPTFLEMHNGSGGLPLKSSVSVVSCGTFLPLVALFLIGHIFKRLYE
jgi:hypothetical protein